MVEHIQPGKRLSGATLHGGLAYLSGQVPDDISVDIKAQTTQVLAKIDALLAAAGSDKTKILTATVWLPNIGDFAAFNEIWDAWVPQPGPARACVESRLALPGIKVEIGLIAVAGR
jgi:enamine deaminase RidA (YjgF/YER057c/UK114 family)